MASHPRRDERSGTLRPVRHGRCAPGLTEPFDESVVVLRDDWDEADYCACEWSDPNTADPYECVAYDLRLLAEETDPRIRAIRAGSYATAPTTRWPASTI